MLWCWTRQLTNYIHHCGAHRGVNTWKATLENLKVVNTGVLVSGKYAFYITSCSFCLRDRCMWCIRRLVKLLCLLQKLPNVFILDQPCEYILVLHQHGSVFTQDGYHYVIFQDLNRAAGQKVESSEHVAAVNQSVSGGSVCGFEVHGQGPQAAFGGSLEGFAVLQQVPVEVKADIRLQALRKTF